MLQIQHSHFNSPCKYTEIKARSQMSFADLSRFRFILHDSSGRRRYDPHYGRGRNGTAKWAGSDFHHPSRIIPLTV